ncbi:MAG TPA: Appr-1-p processing protein [Phycisphaerae bacterium]|nr:Appr-1-p processing protein [Phycisphaerae bacterium]
MIELIQGNILESDAQAIVNTVNCVGVMGRGIALQFKKAFPANFKAYKAVCKQKKLHPGMMFLYDNGTLLSKKQRYIFNFPTKRHWRGKSKIEDIQSGLVALVKEVQEKDIESIAIPALGCGLGGLDWLTVRKMIIDAFENLPDVHVYLYEPAGAPVAKAMVIRTECPNMTPGRAALLGLMHRYLSGLMDVAISLLEVHKLMYFMQEAGEPLRLDYAKGLYGPYARNLGNVLSHIEGHFITGYGDGGDNPDKQIELHSGAAADAERFIQKHPKTQLHFNRISKLIDGFETPYGMELLATVHWVVIHENASSFEEAVSAVHSWNDRKQKIPTKHIKIAWDTLRERGWFAENN